MYLIPMISKPYGHMSSEESLGIDASDTCPSSSSAATLKRWRFSAFNPHAQPKENYRLITTDGSHHRAGPYIPPPSGRKQLSSSQPKTKIPYNLPRLLAAPLTTIVYFVEGEGCADSLTAIGQAD
jgi:hypothetical protein